MSAIPVEDLPICKGGKGLIFPLGGAAEEEWPMGLRSVLYLAGLSYCFLGVTVISDIFMHAIERITSRKILIKMPNGKQRTFRVWNDTVANLTLMALGSSAPEILLNVIEIFKLNFKSGALGPSTIVGSAAFNLLVISAVCIMALPEGDVRRIKDITVYAVTASFSVFAYLWLLFILLVTSPHVVEVWEGVITFLFFPVLVGLAFAADKGWLRGEKRQSSLDAHELPKEELEDLIRQVQDETAGVKIDDHTLMVLVHEKHNDSRPKSRASYRVQRSHYSRMQSGLSLAQGITKKVTKSLSGLTLGGTLGGTQAGSEESQEKKAEKAVELTDVKVDAKAAKISVGFVQEFYAVKESAGSLSLGVQCRRENSDARVTVKYKTVGDTATEGEDFKAISGTLTFEPGQNKKDLKIEIMDDTKWEEAEVFFVDLSDAIALDQASKTSIEIGRGRAKVTIIDDDDPGALAWEKELVEIVDNTDDFTFEIKVERRIGSRGKVSCKLSTEEDTAKSGIDFEEIDQELTFEDGEMEKQVSVTIKAKGRADVEEKFRIVLSEPTGCRLDATTDGGEESSICWVDIKGHSHAKDTAEWIANQLHFHTQQMTQGKDKWKQQFTMALYPAGSNWEEAVKESSPLDWVMHVFNCPWKLIFALIPPVEFANGWVCFFAALVGIGAVTAVIGDLAELLGCSLGVPDIITAITFVALGTSLPDTFASKLAAQMDPYADASIGNITGSNSVNVFLGLGMPWSIGAIYWYMAGATEEWKTLLGDAPMPPTVGLVVQAGDLGFSVLCFATTAGMCMGLLLLRRITCGGELGGPTGPKVASSAFLVLLWVCYIAASWIYIETKEA